MDFDSLKEILSSTLDQNANSSKDKYNSVIQLIDEIQTNSSEPPNAYFHLLLREKYFQLIQTIVESENELLAKFVFNLLDKFCNSESSCQICSHKEKAQFLLNILRYIQHTHINHEMIKMEIFKFLLNNYTTIESLLNHKILLSVMEISINEWQSENRFIQSSCKALIIKYVAVICNQINSSDLGEDLIENADQEAVAKDTYIVQIFSFLLNIFNQEYRAHDLRDLMLECMELLLNNLLIEFQSTSKNAYKIANNQRFIEFTWQQFCPSILFQFGDCGLPAKLSAPQTIAFKNIYTILIQLTGLVGGCTNMISVFEAIYQRILFYPPEQDRHHLLKLFKTYLTDKFIFGLSYCHQASTATASTAAENGLAIDFTLINLIIGFYRNCYDKSMKTPQDKILQFLSCECISSYVQLIYNLYAASVVALPKTPAPPVHAGCREKAVKKKGPTTAEADQDADMMCTDELVELEAFNFFSQFKVWLEQQVLRDGSEMDLDLSVKLFCLNYIQQKQASGHKTDTRVEDDEEGCKKKAAIRYLNYFLSSNSNRVYAATYFSLDCLFAHLLEEPDAAASRSRDFVSRVLAYEEGGSVVKNSRTDDTDDQTNRRDIIKKWLKSVHGYLVDYRRTSFSSDDQLQSVKRAGPFHKQLLFVLKQMSCSKLNQKQRRRSTTKTTAASDEVSASGLLSADRPTEALVVNLLRHSWTYLIDVLTGYVINTKLTNVEKFLALNFDPPTTPDLISSSSSQLSMALTDVSITLFAFKTCLDSLFRILDIISHVHSMDKELIQLLQILQKNSPSASAAVNSSSSNLPSSSDQPPQLPLVQGNDQQLTMNQLICFDFILYATIELVCNPFRRVSSVAQKTGGKKDADEPDANDANGPPDNTTGAGGRRKVTSKSRSILWHHLIETAFLCFKNQSTVDNLRKLNLFCTPRSSSSAGGANETPSKLQKSNNSVSVNKSNSSAAELSRSEHLFKTVYSAQSDLNEENIDNIFSFEIESKRPAAAAEASADPATDQSQSSDRASSRKSSVFNLLSTKTQRALVLKNLFLFLNEKVVIVETGNSRAEEQHVAAFSRQPIACEEFAMNTGELVDLLANSIDRYLFRELLEHLDHYFASDQEEQPEVNGARLEFFGCLWSLCTNLCSFSKRYLLLDKSPTAADQSSSDKRSFRLMDDQSRYFSFNNMIIDKMDDLLIKLVAKLSYSTSSAATSASPPCSIYSMFILELWVHVFLDYFISVCSRCKLSPMNKNRKRVSRKKDAVAAAAAAANLLTSGGGQRSQSASKLKIDAAFKTALRNSATINSIISFASRRADTEENEDRLTFSSSSSSKNKKSRSRHHVAKSGGQVDTGRHQNDHYLIDLSICKKLICLIQKAFDRYNLTTSKHYLQIATNNSTMTMTMTKATNEFGSSAASQQESSSLCSTPITLSKFTLSTQELSDSREIMNYNGQFAEKIQAQSTNLSSRLLLNATSSMLMPDLGDEQQKSVCLIEENVHFNSLFLLPYRRLMLLQQTNRTRSLDAHLQDAMLTSICELVESSATKIKTSWSCLFECISQINLCNSSDRAVKRAVPVARPAQSTDSDSAASQDSDDTGSRHYVSDSSYNSNSSGVSSLAGSRSSSSSSASSSSSDFSATSNISYHFDSYRIRMNTLVDIFNLYLALASNTNYILAKGSFAFLKCLFNYLQDGSLAGSNSSLVIKKAVKDEDAAKKPTTTQETPEIVGLQRIIGQPKGPDAENGEEEEDDDDEDLYSSANDYDLQQRHYHMTSNYDHLLKLANANNSNTLIKPFLRCLEQFFHILIKRRMITTTTRRRRKVADEENCCSPDSLNSFVSFSKLVFKMDDDNAATSGFHKLRSLPPLDPRLFAGLSSYDLSGLGIEADLANIESESELAKLSDSLAKHLREHDQQNYFKMFAFIIKQMSARILAQQDELNCVQMVELLHSFLASLFEAKQYILLVYCLLDIVLVNLDEQIDAVEVNYAASNVSNKPSPEHKPPPPPPASTSSLINSKLSQNVFFLSNLLCKRLKKFVSIFSDLVSKAQADLTLKEEEEEEKDEDAELSSGIVQLGIGCVYSRLTYLLSKVMLRKITNFDSLIELDVLNDLSPTAKLRSTAGFAKFFDVCFAWNNLELNEKLVRSMRLFHSLSLIPLNTLIKHYKEDDVAEDQEDEGPQGSRTKNKYSNLEVLTKKCRSAWHLHNVKKCFSLAKVLLFDEQCLLFGFDPEGGQDPTRPHGGIKEPDGQVSQVKVDFAAENTEIENMESNENNNFPNNPTNDENNAKSTSNDGSNADVNQLTSSTEEKSFYRDFTLKFHVPSSSAVIKSPSPRQQAAKQKTISDIFGACEDNAAETPSAGQEAPREQEEEEEGSQVKQLNLTCFIASLRLHLNILRLIGSYAQRPQQQQQLQADLGHRIELVKCFNRTYLFSLKVDRMLSFKILISKIFYLNYEQSLANFVHFAKIAYLTIGSIYFNFLFPTEKSSSQDRTSKSVDYEFEFEAMNDSATATLMENFLGQRSMSQDKREQFSITNLEDKMGNVLESIVISSDDDADLFGPLNQYFIFFIQHFAKYYYYLNESSHNFKLNKTYLKTMIDKFKGQETSNPVEDEEKREDEGPTRAQEAASSLASTPVDVSDSLAVDQEVIRLFKLNKQHNKALTMLNLTKQNETKIKLNTLLLPSESSSTSTSSAPQRAESGGEELNEESPGGTKPTNDLIYSQRDARFRYQVWSAEMIARFLLCLNEPDEEGADGSNRFESLLRVYTRARDDQKSAVNVDLLNSLSQIIVVFNSCSSYCDCSIIDLNSKLDLNQVRDISARLLTNIFKIYKNNLTLAP